MGDVSGGRQYIDRLAGVNPAVFSPYVLVVEDDLFSKKLFTKVLNEKFNNPQIFYARNIDEAQRLLTGPQTFDLIFIDIFLDDSALGVDLYFDLLERQSHALIIMTSSLEIHDYQRLFGKGMNIPPYLKKPFRPQTCIDLIELYTAGDFP